MSNRFRALAIAATAIAILCFGSTGFGQTETATVSGRVTDSTGAIVQGAKVELLALERGIRRETTTNEAGIYIFSACQPGQYHITVRKEGFRQVDVVGLVVNVQDHLENNVGLQAGSAAESITVSGGAPLVDTEDATVSTVVDRQFAENLPLNGRSFHTLIELTPGVVLTSSNEIDGGQFSINGQRAASNYWMVDGVSANFGTNASGLFPGTSSGGTAASFSALGGTNSLVSVDALQEFRIQTSTYAPEFGRTPGGQISIVTRSGTNRFQGTLFDYFRNDVLDASNWFNGYTNPKPLPKAKERQNDFGGTFSGPIIKDRTFFFFSYEGLRLRLPQTSLSTVPDLAARQNATPPVQPFLNAYPLPNGADDVVDGTAQFNASFSNPASLDAYSLRVDHNLNDKLVLFGRYDYSPSELRQRGLSGTALSGVFPNQSTTETTTLGSTWQFSPTTVNDFRINYSRTEGRSFFALDGFHGAVPLSSLPLPKPYTSQNADFDFFIASLLQGALGEGQTTHNLQRQINVTDNVSIQRGLHSIKVGADYRRLSPLFDPPRYLQEPIFSTVAQAESGNVAFAFLTSKVESTLLFHNLGMFAQDTWRTSPRLTLTYGIRWDVDFTPSTARGPHIPALGGFNLNDLSNLTLAPSGTPPFKTSYDNFAPRVAIAYTLPGNVNTPAILRGGFGVFYDLATSQAGQVYGLGDSYPFGGSTCCPSNVPFPFSPSLAAPPPITTASLLTNGIYAFDPAIRLPYTLEWNLAFEKGFAQQQSLSVSYVGSGGRRLLQTADILSPSQTLGLANVVTNRGESAYNALQLQFKRRLVHGLQALVSYSWSHSIDTGSSGSFENTANTFVLGNGNQNRGPSDFDIRHSMSAAFTYEIPSVRVNRALGSILHSWSIDSIFQARSAPPEDISYGNTFAVSALKNSVINIRPDVRPGQPLYLYGSQYPGGKAFNPAAFAPPPADSNGAPLRQGDLGRNSLRALGAMQWDFSVHRDFSLRESLKLQFRAELFNLINHPNFGPLNSTIDQGGFGIATQMLAQSLTDFVGNGLAPIYQIGGPRSAQLALKIVF